MRYMYVHLGFIGISGNKVYLRFYVYFKWLYMGMYGYILVFMGTCGTAVSDNQEKRFN